MISPGELLGVPKFEDWYPGQEGLFNEITEWLAGPERFMGAALPTGYGKSLLGMLAAHTSGMRTVFLTSTKALQTQLMTDFRPVGLVDIRGRNEYVCDKWTHLKADEAPCTGGYKCPLSNTDYCDYFKHLNRAKRERLVVTNYQCFMSHQVYTPEGLNLIIKDIPVLGGQIVVNKTKLLICDEAHLAAKALENFMTFTMTPRDREWLPWREDWDYRNWNKACRDVAGMLESELDGTMVELQDTEPGFDWHTELVRRVRYLRALQRKCNMLTQEAHDWVYEYEGEGKNQRTVWTPLWPGRYNHNLFGGVPKVLLMSAMMTKPMMDRLEVKGVWLNSPSPFPPGHTQVIHLNTARIHHRADDEALKRWVDRIDEIIEGRQDQKGIVFTVSYARARFLAEKSRFGAQMMQHSSKDIADVVKRFKRADAPAILVSPSVTTGFDFPEDECKYIIVGKIPYPDTRGAVAKARNKEDKSWTSQMAMETLVQEAGRGTRSATDRCQVFVVDASWKWWWWRYRDLAPKWFQERVIPTSLDRVPRKID